MDALDQAFVLRCGLRVAGRVAMAPLTNTQSEVDGRLGEAEFCWLVRRARDGFPFISTCAAFVSAEGQAWRGQLGISTDAHLPGLTTLAAALAEQGSIAVVQLHHAGAKAERAPQPLSTADVDGSRGATADDIDRVIVDFVAAARRAETAGFAGVEIHGANGYLFTQFLAPEDNPRTDGYGGDLAGRARFLRETVRAVRAAVSPGFAVGVRLSPVDTWARRGLMLDDSLQVARWLVEDGVDFVHLSLRNASGRPPFEDESPVVVRAMRAALPDDVAIFVAGGIWDRADALQALTAGADFAVLGRASIVHPDWTSASKALDFEPMRPPWSLAHLRAVDAGEAMIAYLKGFRGMVEGGALPRG
ncbi:MAG: 2,4-dienoyl-CoA reductase-like NADH-dependent reductase (Old Yellow Enzyme family) [Bradymonadia bacterium]|jgi:2,4-dienoyl-CoA reductase-like NADH-dependent reductase (Old Yellow Enzyme family)